MAQDEAVKALRDVWESMKTRFPKPYSADRLEQLRQALTTAEMSVRHLHEEETREEHDERQASQITKMIHGSRDADLIPQLTEEEARKRVMAGERV